jgi:hypothetical protein
MIELVGDDGEVIKVPATARYKAKIDGQEQDVNFDQLSRSYQKGAAADKRLEEASRRVKELEEKERALTEREQAFLAQQEKLDQRREAGTVSESAYLEKAKQLLAALTSEEDEEPEKQIAAWLQGVMTNPEDATAKAKKELMAEWERRQAEAERRRKEQTATQERLKANKRFETEFADIVGDRISYAAAKTLAQEKWRERPSAEPWEIAFEVGTEIRSAKEPAKPVKTVTPKTASARASIGKDEPVETREDVLRQIRLSRGQPV